MASVEAPPQFPGAPKKSKTGLILGGLALAVVLCCCGCGGLFYYFGKGAIKGITGFAGCGLAMDERREALLAYAEAHKGLLPPAQNWQTAIKPYLTNSAKTQVEGAPIDIPGPDDDFCDKGAGTSISYNSAVAGKKVADIKDQMGTIALFETAGLGKNKSAAWSEPPFATSPILLMNERRGWIRQALKGEAAMKDKRGRLTPISDMGNKGGVRVETKASTGTSDEP